VIAHNTHTHIQRVRDLTVCVQVGMIEVVLDSETTASITAAAGGVTAAFRCVR
jgi:hypothetical protein